MEFLLNSKKAQLHTNATVHRHQPLPHSHSYKNITTIQHESPIRRTTTTTATANANNMPNHDHFTVSPMAQAINPMREHSILQVSPSNSLGSASTSSNSSLPRRQRQHHTTNKQQHHKKHHHHHHHQHHHYPRNGPRQPMSPTNELRLQLLQRMAEYRAKGWINPTEERNYIQRLTTRGNPATADLTDLTARQLQQELDFIAKTMERQQSQSQQQRSAATTLTRLENYQPASSNQRIGGTPYLTTPLLPPSASNLRSPVPPQPPALKAKKSNLVSATSKMARRLPARRVSFAPMTESSHVDNTTTTAYNNHHGSSSSNNTTTNTNDAATSNATNATTNHTVNIDNSNPITAKAKATTASNKSNNPIPSLSSTNLPDHKRNIPKSELVRATVKMEDPTTPTDPTPELPRLTILEPTALWNQLQQQQPDDPNDGNNSPSAPPNSNASIIQNMFVEMCFFARLGFVQPPCCLYCAYRESVNQEAPRLDCQRWVVWRKNALTLLHPHRLHDNLLAVQCQTARKLSNGVTMDAHMWDAQRKQLVLHM